MGWQQFNENLSFISRSFTGHDIDFFHHEIMLIHEHNPCFSDAAKQCMENAKTFPLGDQRRIYWEAAAENFRNGIDPE